MVHVTLIECPGFECLPAAVNGFESEVETAKYQSEMVEIAMQSVLDRLGNVDVVVDQFAPIAAAPVERAIGCGDPAREHGSPDHRDPGSSRSLFGRHASDGRSGCFQSTTNLRILADTYSKESIAALIRARACRPKTAISWSRVNVSAYMAISRGCVIVRKPDTSSTFACASSKM